MKKLRVTVEGKTYEVLVELLDEGTPAAAPVATPASASVPVSLPVVAPLKEPASPAPSAPRGPAGAGDIVSPLSGKVVSIDVKVGQAVDEGTQVVTLEAMKMNTYVYASRAGRVTEIFAIAGEGVEEGAALLRLG